MFNYFKRCEITIDTANKTYSQDFDLDKDVYCITGFLLTSDQDDQLYYRGQQSISLNGVEYFPTDFESKLLMTGINTAPNTRFYDIGKHEVVNGKVKIVYTDEDNPIITFSPYRVTLWVRGKKINQP